MSPLPHPQPFATSHVLCGRDAELAQLCDELQARLVDSGWIVSESSDSTPTRITRLHRDDEWIVVSMAPPAPHRLSRPHDVELAATGRIRDHEAVHALMGALPFTPLEIEVLSFDMPLTASIADRVADWLPGLELNAQPLAAHGAVFTIHHQTDFVLLLERALALGLERELVTVIDKEYRYSHAQRVDAHIRERLGIPVFRYRDLTEGLTDHIRRVEAHRQREGARTWLPTVIVDDGGYVLPVLLEKFEPHLNLFKGVVEQTKSGIWKLRPYEHDLRLPVFSVAESELKASVEAHGVAQAAITNLRRLLPQEKIDGRRAVVVGYGVVGRALAERLRRHNVEVHVVDISDSMRVTAREQGFQVGDALPDLIARVTPRYVFSCAEPGAVDAEAFAAISTDCVLVSLTSRDVAFDKDALAALAEPTPFGNIATVYRCTGPERNLLLIADGFPINFHFAESMPNQQSDLVMASLLVGAVELACSAPSWPPGNDRERANEILNEGTLLRDFLDLQPGALPPDA